MFFRDENHAEHWAEAVEAAGAFRDDDTVNSHYGASLFIITGIPGLYSRAKSTYITIGLTSRLFSIWDFRQGKAYLWH